MLELTRDVEMLIVSTLPLTSTQVEEISDSLSSHDDFVGKVGENGEHFAFLATESAYAFIDGITGNYAIGVVSAKGVSEDKPVFDIMTDNDEAADLVEELYRVDDQNRRNSAAPATETDVAEHASEEDNSVEDTGTDADDDDQHLTLSDREAQAAAILGVNNNQTVESDAPEQPDTDDTEDANADEEIIETEPDNEALSVQHEELDTSHFEELIAYITPTQEEIDSIIDMPLDAGSDKQGLPSVITMQYEDFLLAVKSLMASDLDKVRKSDLDYLKVQARQLVADGEIESIQDFAELVRQSNEITKAIDDQLNEYTTAYDRAKSDWLNGVIADAEAHYESSNPRLTRADFKQKYAEPLSVIEDSLSAVSEKTRATFFKRLGDDSKTRSFRRLNELIAIRESLNSGLKKTLAAIAEHEDMYLSKRAQQDEPKEEISQTAKGEQPVEESEKSLSLTPETEDAARQTDEEPELDDSDIIDDGLMANEPDDPFADLYADDTTPVSENATDDAGDDKADEEDSDPIAAIEAKMFEEIDPSEYSDDLEATVEQPAITESMPLAPEGNIEFVRPQQSEPVADTEKSLFDDAAIQRDKGDSKSQEFDTIIAGETPKSDEPKKKMSKKSMAAMLAVGALVISGGSLGAMSLMSDDEPAARTTTTATPTVDAVSKEIQQKFRRGDKLEVEVAQGIISVRIIGFNDSGAVAVDSTGKEWLIDNNMLKKWAEAHPDEVADSHSETPTPADAQTDTPASHTWPLNNDTESDA